MRRLLLTLVVLALAAITLLPGESADAWQSNNLLENPGFEGQYYAWSGMNEVHVAHGWTPWRRDRKDSDPDAYFFKPEYKRANGWIYPQRVHGGVAAQQWFTSFATHQAGMYQQVFGVRPGTRYQFSVWAQVWSSTGDDSSVSTNPAYPNLQMGIHPTGGWNPWAGTVIWSAAYAFYDSWGQLAIEATVQNDVITVFMRSDPNFPVKHNDFYWDDAALVVAGQPIPPAPPPTATSAGLPPPIATAGATPEPTATCAPAPSDWVTYHVVRGDTLYSLSRRSGNDCDQDYVCELPELDDYPRGSGAAAAQAARYSHANQSYAYAATRNANHHEGAEADGYAHSRRVGDSHQVTDGYRNGNTYQVTYGHSNGNANEDANSHGNGNADEDADSHGNGNTDEDANGAASYCCTCDGDAGPRSSRYCDAHQTTTYHPTSTYFNAGITDAAADVYAFRQQHSTLRHDLRGGGDSGFGGVFQVSTAWQTFQRIKELKRYDVWRREV